MRSFVLMSLLATSVAACAAPPVEGDSLGNGDEVGLPERAHGGKTDGGSSNPTPTPVDTKQTLTVALTGAGSITSTPTGLACSATSCTGTFAKGTAVSLKANPANGSLFGSFGGACTGAACSVTMDAAKNVSASFVSLTGSWKGTYTNTRPNQGCTFNNAGDLTVTNATTATDLTTSAAVTGLEIRNLNGCALVGKVNGTSPTEPLTIAGDAITGTWNVAVNGGGTLPFPFTAKLSGDTITGSWTCTNCSGSFTLSRAP